jgi:hypothetical protein
VCSSDLFSTFAKFVKMGEYGPDWGTHEPENLVGWEVAE